MAKSGEVVLDFSQVKPFEPMDSSPKYLTRCTKLELGTSKEGKPKAHCELTIESPEEVKVEEWLENEDAAGGMSPTGKLLETTTKAKGRILFREFSLEPQALPFLHEAIKAWNPKVDLGENFKFNPKEYEGLQSAVSIQNEAFDEQVRARVRRMYPASAYKEA